MNSTPPFKTAKPRVHRKRRSATFGPPPDVLTLVAASFDWDAVILTLMFDRPIDLGLLDASAIMEYFEPLRGWLKQQNKGQKCGW